VECAACNIVHRTAFKISTCPQYFSDAHSISANAIGLYCLNANWCLLRNQLDARQTHTRTLLHTASSCCAAVMKLKRSSHFLVCPLKEHSVN
jgi:hypothetical protein